MNLDLVDTPQLIFHGVFNRYDIDLVGHNLLETGIESGCLTAPGGSGNQDHALGLADKIVNGIQTLGAESEVRHGEEGFLLVQNSNDRFLPVIGGEGGHTQVD